MKTLSIAATTTLVLGSTAATAGGLDRSGQDISILFEQGSLLTATMSYANPTVSATNETETGDIADPYLTVGAAFKYAVTDDIDLALIMDQPFGADVSYKENRDGKADATLDTTAFTLLARYKFNENFSVHAGVRAQNASAEVSLADFFYTLDMKSDFAFGYSVGAAYEIPSIAARVAVTYNSAITQTFTGTEGHGVAVDSEFETQTPQSVNLDFQTGIMADTLLFGSVRWADWSAFAFEPTNFAANPLVSYDADTISSEIGVGRKFTDKFSASVSFGYEAATGGIESDLGPTDGYWSVGVGGKYQLSENFEIAGGARYVKIGDATGETVAAGVPFTDNSAYGFGLQLTSRF